MSGFNDQPSVPLWLDGEQVTTTATFDVVSPGTNKTLYQSSAATVKDAEAAVKSAEAALEAWSSTTASVRREVFLKAAQLFVERKEELKKLSQSETGAPDPYFEFDFNDALDHCKTVAGYVNSATTGTTPSMLEEGRTALVVREPYGVILAIASWNAPLVLGFRALAAALACGNTVVFKGAESSPGCHWALASILYDAGLPKGCLNTVVHRREDGPEVVSALIAHPSIKKISFTGSTNVGAIIAAQAGKHLKPTVMELGGKAPTIVCEDADLEQAALGVTLGAFLYSGQICMSAERVLVHKNIMDKFKPILKATIDNVFGQLEDGLPLITTASVDKVKKLLNDAVSKGANVVHGDVSHESSVATHMRPVVIENVQEGMDIYYTESFGPSVSLYAIESDDEAIRIANDTEYGLASSVYTEDLRRGLKIARRIETGAVHINSMSVHDESALPHGGAKKSGWVSF